MNKVAKIFVGSIAAISVIGVGSAIASSANSVKAGAGVHTSVAPSGTTKSPAKESSTSKSDTIRACIASPYVTQLQLGPMGMTDIYTTLTGGFMNSASTGKGKLIVAAFQRCASTDDGAGLVTVYGADGDIVTNGNF
jgi:hypothetical protein